MASMRRYPTRGAAKAASARASGAAIAMKTLQFVAALVLTPEEADDGGQVGRKRKKPGRLPGKSKRQRRADGASVTADGEGGRGDEANAAGSSVQFRLAQLHGDVTDAMLLDANAVVPIMWLDTPAGPGEAERYQYAFTDRLEVPAILCLVSVHEQEDGKFTLTSASKEWIADRLSLLPKSARPSTTATDGKDKVVPVRHTKVGSTGLRAPRHRSEPASQSALPKPRQTRGVERSDEVSTDLPPPRCATVDQRRYQPRELRGTDRHEKCECTTCGNREVIRAVLTKDIELLKQLTSDERERKRLYSFRASQSADVSTTALLHAVELNDLDAASVLIEGAAGGKEFGSRPTISLPDHMVIKHTPHSTHVKRIAVSHNRKEGNHALLDDTKNPIDSYAEKAEIFSCPSASIEMFHALYQTQAWRLSKETWKWFGIVARHGNYRLMHELIELLVKRGKEAECKGQYLRLLSNKFEEANYLTATSALKPMHKTRICPVHLAAINPDSRYLRQIWEMVGKDGCVNARADDRWQPIHFASVCEGSGPLEFLIEENCGLLDKVKGGMTPIMCALKCRRSANALILLEAAASRSADELKQLIGARNSKSMQALHVAAQFGCSDVISQLVQRGAGVNSCATNNTSALCLAAQSGHLACVETLLSLGAAVDPASTWKKTPLMLAVKNGHTDIAAMLINHGANINARDSSENTVAHYAASYGWASCVELLIDAGADMWSRNIWGYVPAAAARFKQFTCCWRPIFDRCDADRDSINFRDRDGCTILFLLCKDSAKLAELECLLEKGVDPNISDNKGVGPLQLLIERSVPTPFTRDGKDREFCIAAIRLLLQHGVATTIDKDMKTSAHIDQPIVLAIRKRQLDVVGMLLQDGRINPNAAGARGYTAWLAAAEQGEEYLDALVVNLGIDSINFDVRTLDGNNFFHCVAEAAPKFAVKVLSFITSCSNASSLLNEKNIDGLSPLLLLLKHERTAPSSSDGDFTRNAKLDRSYCDLVATFAAHTTDPGAFTIAFAPQRSNLQFGNPNVTELSVSSTFKDADSGSSQFNFSDNRNMSTTVVHLACCRKLQVDAEQPQDRWYGDHLLEVLLKALPDRGRACADSPTENPHFATPLLCAVKSRDARSATMLLEECGANPDHSTVRCSACHQSEASPWTVCECSDRPLVETALIHAVRQNDTVMTKLLLANGASTRCSDIQQARSPLHLAVTTGNVELVQCMIDASDELNLKDCDGKTPLHLAVSSGTQSCVAALLESGANPAETDNQCRTPLVEAILAGYTVVKAKKVSSVRYSPTTDQYSALNKFMPPSGGQRDSATTSSNANSANKSRSRNLGSRTASGFEWAATPSVSTSNLFGGRQAAPSSVGSSQRSQGFGFFGSGKGSGFGSGGGFGSGSGFGSGGGFGGAFNTSRTVSRQASAARSGTSTVTSTIAQDGGRLSQTTGVSTSANSTGSVVSSQVEESMMEIYLTNDAVKRTILIGDKSGRCAIHYAAQKRDIDLLRELIGTEEHDKRVQFVNVRDAFGRTPLHLAVNNATTIDDVGFDVERLLLSCGAEVNAVDNFGCSALHFALRKLDADVDMSLLVAKSKSTVDTRADSVGETNDSDRATKSQAYLDYLHSTVSTYATDPVEIVSNLASVPGVNVLLQDSLGATPLHLAAASGAAVCVPALFAALPSGTDRRDALTMRDKDGFTPLACAFQRMRQATITAMIQNGASVAEFTQTELPVRSKSACNFGEEERCSFFYLALKHAIPGVYPLLLNHGFSRRQALEDALRLGEFQLASTVIGRMEVAGESHTMAERNQTSGKTLLHCLSQTKKPFDDPPQNIAAQLIRSGVDATEMDAKGNSALHYAAREVNIHLIEFLLNHGCDINQRNEAGETPLLYALKHIEPSSDSTPCYRVLNFFVSHPSTDLAVVDTEGFTVVSSLLEYLGLQLETRKDEFLWLELLLQRGVDLDHIFPSKFVSSLSAGLIKKTSPPSQASLRVTPLIWAAYAPHPSTRMALLALLLNYGARITTADSDGNSVLMHLVARNLSDEIKLVMGGYRQVLNQFTDGVYDVEIPLHDIQLAVRQQNNLGQTALHLSVSTFGYASYENDQVAKMLLANGADMKVLDTSGRTALDCGRDQFIERLCGGSEDIAMTDVSAVATSTWDCPDYESDADAYLESCEANGDIQRTTIDVGTHPFCHTGSDNCVLSLPSSSDATDDGATDRDKLSVLLAKIETMQTHSMYFRLQAVHDKIQNIFVVFSNGGHIHSSTRVRCATSDTVYNAVFRSADAAIAEFKSIFRAKTGNDWEDRHQFVRKPNMYILVTSKDVRLRVAASMMQSFTAQNAQCVASANMEVASPFPALTTSYPKSLMELLYAITDIPSPPHGAGSIKYCRNGSNLDMLLRRRILAASIHVLEEIRSLLKQRSEVDAKIAAMRSIVEGSGNDERDRLLTERVKLHAAFRGQLARYFDIMPFRANRHTSIGWPIELPQTIDSVKKELWGLKMLFNLSHVFTMVFGAKLRQREVHPLEYCYRSLQVKLDILPPESDEALLLTQYFLNGIRANNRAKYRLGSIFEVERRGEAERLAQFKPSLETARLQPRLLWHGTQTTNLMSIFAHGLRVVGTSEELASGTRYERGLYFADVAAKSLEFCNDHYIADRDSPRQVYYLLLCEVALGNVLRYRRLERDQLLPKGTDCVLVSGELVPNSDKDVVSAACGAVIPLGEVGQVGMAYAGPTVWAAADTDSTSWLNWSQEGVAMIDTLVSAMEVGEHRAIEADKQSRGLTSYIGSSVDVQLLKKPVDDSTWELYDAAVQVSVTRTEPTVQTQTVEARRYRSIHQVQEGFSPVIPFPRTAQHNEYIVFKEEQVRIRYVVEIEVVAPVKA